MIVFMFAPCISDIHTLCCPTDAQYVIRRYSSVQNLLSPRLLSKNVKIKIYRTIILPVVLYGCESWSLTLREGKEAEGV